MMKPKVPSRVPVRSFRFAPWVISLALAGTSATAGDWPAYRGPDGIGHSPETGLLTSWPAAGPKELWRVEIGRGYSGIAVRDGRAFTQFGQGGEEIVAAFDADTGKEIWRAVMDRDRPDGQGGGPRSTPAVDGGVVFALGASGTLEALSAADGGTVWSRDLRADFGARIPQWGVSTSPVVADDLLLIEAGGKAEHALLALDKATGALRWHSRSEPPGYSTPIVVRIAGHEQAVFFTGAGLVATDLDDGTPLWAFPWLTDYGVSAAMPIFLPPNKIFISTGYGRGAVLLQINAAKTGFEVTEVWRSKVMQNHFNSSVLVDGFLYGFDNATLKCIEAISGDERWAERGFGKGSLLYADGHLFVLSERGVLLTVEATPETYRERSRVQVLKGKTWTMPSLADGRLFVRNERELVALDLRR